MRRRELAAVLRRYRKDARLDSTKVSRQLGWDPSKISRIEGGRFRRIDPRDVLDLLTVYGVTDEQQREAIEQIARDSRARGWWESYTDVFRSELPDLEAGARQILAWEGKCVPGLLQTPDYTTALLAGLGVSDGDELARRVAARVARQEILVHEQPPQLTAVIDEAVLLRLVGGEAVMKDQIRQLIQLASWPNIQIRLIPNTAGAHPGMCGSFTILRFAGDIPAVVFSERPIGPDLVDKPDEIDQYMQLHERLMVTALPPEDTLTAMRNMAGTASEG